MASSSSAPALKDLVPEVGYLYPPGKELVARVFLPFRPFDNPTYKPPFNEEGDHGKAKGDISKMSIEDYVFATTPRQQSGKELPPSHAMDYLSVHSPENPVKTTLRVTGGLSMSVGLGSQVLLCEVVKPPAKLWNAMGHRGYPSVVVAKVFDPLYYPKSTPWSTQTDVVSLADKAFAHEAAAYMELHHCRKKNPVINDFVPKFYGTFSTVIPRKGAKGRPVRIVLMEFIEGESIVDMSDASVNKDNYVVLEPPQDVGKEMALLVFQKVLHGLTAMENRGVFQDDLDSSNVIVSLQKPNRKKNSKKELPSVLHRVVMVDFDRSMVTRYTQEGFHFAQLLEKPLHPAARFGLRGLESFAGWFPVEWLIEKEERRSQNLKESESDDEEEFDPETYDIDNDNRLSLWEKWAHKAMTKKDFTMGNDADILAYEHDMKEEARAKEAEEFEERKKAAEARHIERDQGIEDTANALASSLGGVTSFEYEDAVHHRESSS